MKYTYEEVYDATKNYFSGNDLSTKVFVDKYALRDIKGNYLDLTPHNMHDRLAKEFAKIDQRHGGDYDFHYDSYRKALDQFARIVPQGSPMSAVGNTHQRMSASNCVVIESPKDDMGGIVDAGKELAQLYKRRCGVGLDISELRPEGEPVGNAARTTTGAWSFADFYSYITRMVGQNSRRGALMITMSVHHPDVGKFITMKNDPTKVTGANVSLRLSDEFLQAVENDEEYEVRWPIDNPKINKKISAKKIWDTIVQSATDTAEPGLIMWDNMTRELPAHCYPNFKTISTNPCSEIALSAYDSCRLISINLTGYVRNAFEDNAKFDMASFKRDVDLAQRMADNLVDIELDLIDRIKEACGSKEEVELWNKLYKAGQRGRRTGVGTHGLGDTLAQLCLKYDSEEALEMVDKIYKSLRNTAYATSITLAEERGAFPDFDWELEKDCPYIKRLPKALRDKMQKVGRRNISLLTQAPTGSVSMLSKVGDFDMYNVSSGVEPVFRNSYTRRKKINPGDENTRVDYVDKMGDSWEEFVVYHSNVDNFLKKMTPLLGKVDLPDYFVTSDQIDWEKRVELQGVEQQYIDHSISSCLATGEHLVHTSDGLIYIEDIVGKQSEKGFYPINGCKTINSSNKQVPITEGYYNGVADCLKVSFSGMRSITGTANHKLYVLQHDYNKHGSWAFDWKELKDIKKGDFVISRIGLECFGDSQKHFSTTLGKFKTNISGGSTKKIKLPKRMSKDLARFLGYLISDGSVSKNGVQLSQLNNNVVDDFVQIVHDIFGLDSYICPDSRVNNLVSVQVNSRILRDFVKYLGVNGRSFEKTVPEAIFKCAGRRQTAEFIRGLTLDGFVSESKIGVMTSASSQLCHEIQTLLDQFGIDSGIVKSNDEGTIRSISGGPEYSTRDAWTVYCGLNESQKFTQLIGFAEDRKNEEAIHKLRSPSRKSLVGRIPDMGIRAEFRKNVLPNIKSNRLYEIFHSLTCSSKYNMDITRDSLLMMKDIGKDALSTTFPDEFIDPTFVFREVVSVENVGEKETYDISVENGRSYVVNNIISHNTINLPKGTLPSVVSNVYMSAWKKGLKGITVYVDGSRDGVLITDTGPEIDEDGRPTNIVHTESPKRPSELLAEIHHATVKGVKWTVLIGLLNNEPYELFMGQSDSFGIASKHSDGKLIKLKGGIYNLLDLTNNILVDNVLAVADNNEGAWTTRMMSMSLRHGVPIEYLVDQLSKDGSVVDVNMVLGRLLRKYMKKKNQNSAACPQCGSNNLVYEDGCNKCTDCGFSGCQ